MLDLFAKDAAHIYIACGTTDFRKQIDGLAAIVNLQFNLDHSRINVLSSFATKEKQPLKF